MARKVMNGSLHSQCVSLHALKDLKLQYEVKANNDTFACYSPMIGSSDTCLAKLLT